MTALKLRMFEESRSVIEYEYKKKAEESDFILEGIKELWIEREQSECRNPRKRRPESLNS